MTVWACDPFGSEEPDPSFIVIRFGSPSMTVERGAVGTTTVRIFDSDFLGDVNLAVSDVPSGVTVALETNPLNASANRRTSLVTIAVGSSAAVGTFDIKVKATGVNLIDDTRTITLTVPPGSLALTAGSTTATLTPGGATTVPVTITRGGGYADPIALAVSGLPAGVTGTFSPATIAAGSTTSTLTLVADASAAQGAAALTITASGTGVNSQTATVSLTVTAATSPALALSAGPAALSVTSGASATSTISMTRTGGFAGDVSLALTGAPAGVTASFAPTTVLAANSTSTLTIAVGATTMPGVYNLSVTGTGTGVSPATTAVTLTVNAAPTITVSAAPTALPLAPGSITTSTITLARTNYSGDVTLAATGLPSGVSASFAPATLTGGTLTSTLTLTASAGASLGSQTITVSAAGTGVTTATVGLTLTVAVAPNFTLAATSVSAAQGTTGTSTVTIARTGSYAGAVTLATSGPLSGVTVSISPNGTTGTSATLTLTVGAGAPTGTSTITVTGTGAGLTGTVTTTFTLTVTASGTNVTWTFCNPARFPLWFAAQNGANGTWTPVTATGTSTRTYVFPINTLGGVAYAEDNGSGGVQMTVQYLSDTELAAQGSQKCATDPARTSYTATFVNVLTGQFANLSLGGSSANVTGPAASATVFQAPTGTRDLLAVRYSINLTTLAQIPFRGILRRNNTSTTIPTLDMTGAESFDIASAPFTVNNTLGESLTAISSLSTSNGQTASLAYGVLTGTTSPITVYGVPSSVLQTGDQHQVLITASAVSGGATTTRMIYQYNQQLAPRTVTLGAAPISFIPTTVSGGGYTRYASTGAWQSDYPDAVGIGYLQSSGNSWSISMSRTYAGSGASAWTLAMPNFTGLAGFQNSWGLSAGSMNWSWTTSGFLSGYNSFTNTFGEGASWRAASRTGSMP